MARVHHARRIARAAAYGGGGLLGLGAATLGGLIAQSQQARKAIGQRRESAPYADGRYGHAKGTSLRLALLGDSAAAGLGADNARDTIGAVLASLVSEYSGQPVVLSTVAEVGARSRHLDEQVTRALHYKPHVAVIIIGTNDVTHIIRPQVSVRYLDASVRHLRDNGVQVVVGTCPDLGTITPIDPPLRWVARRLSRSLAAAQAICVVEAGGRAVSLADLLGPEFGARPEVLFSRDRFHPSSEGYRATAQVLAPSVLAALSRGASGEVLPDLFIGRTIAPLPQAAAEAAENPGTEVSATTVGGRQRGAFGRWARLGKRILVHRPARSPAVDEDSQGECHLGPPTAVR
ncbi:MAG: SGNH/GDSL hydrolase family protein [Candidatus Nanopelagicales bacterium]|nr:SGNH/GDSL hydrolase family protein [Candidatus Nanopelagicales bacterium]